MSVTMSEKEIPETWVGQRVRVGHAHSASTHTDGVLLGVGDRGIVVEGELVRFYPWTSVGSIKKRGLFNALRRKWLDESDKD